MTLTPEEVQAIAQQVAAIHGAPAVPEPVAPVPTEPKANAFVVGSLVTHESDDPYTGRSTRRDGIVVAVVADTGDGTGPKAEVAWLNERSGAVPESELSSI